MILATVAGAGVALAARAAARTAANRAEHGQFDGGCPPRRRRVVDRPGHRHLQPARGGRLPAPGLPGQPRRAAGRAAAEPIGVVPHPHPGPAAAGDRHRRRETPVRHRRPPQRVGVRQRRQAAPGVVPGAGRPDRRSDPRRHGADRLRTGDQRPRQRRTGPGHRPERGDRRGPTGPAGQLRRIGAAARPHRRRPVPRGRPGRGPRREQPRHHPGSVRHPALGRTAPAVPRPIDHRGDRRGPDVASGTNGRRHGPGPDRPRPCHVGDDPPIADRPDRAGTRDGHVGRRALDRRHRTAGPLQPRRPGRRRPRPGRRSCSGRNPNRSPRWPSNPAGPAWRSRR